MNFNLYSQYYDLLYQDKDYYAESDYIEKLIHIYGSPGKNILELGSGTGKHARILASKGYKVHGIEKSLDMLNVALSQPLDNVSYEQGDICNFSLDTKYDIALSLFHVISYLTNNQSLSIAFQNIYNSLNKNGIFIFDVWHTVAVMHQQPENRTKELSDDNVSVTRIARPVNHHERSVVDVNYEIIIKSNKNDQTSHINELHSMRHFNASEIETLAKSVNFDVVKSEEFFTGKQPDNNTWGVCYILKKN